MPWQGQVAAAAAATAGAGVGAASPEATYSAHCSVAAAFRTLVVRSFIFLYFFTFINSKEVCA